MFPVRYELGFYIPADGILHRRRREKLKSWTIIYLLPEKVLKAKLLDPKQDT
jgi:hypothetical protein